MNEQHISLEPLTDSNLSELRSIQREDVSEDFADTLMGFVIDRRYRSLGIGGYVLEKAIDNCYSEFGVRSVALGCHKDNHRAAAFYTKHGFGKTDAMEGNDYYYLRYPI